MLVKSSDIDRVSEVLDQRQEAQDWLEASYYGQWEKTYKRFNCEMPERKDADGKNDPEKSHIAMPDTWAMVNRRVARITANLPDIGFVAEKRSEVVERAVSRKVMWDWDTGKVQKGQKRHVRQADMFGWSVRQWWWEVNEHERRRGVDVSDINAIAPPDLAAIAKTYGVDDKMMADPRRLSIVVNELVKRYARRGLLDVRYLYKAYEGPRSRVLFVGDCYPEPFFDDLQSSGYFISVTRRNEDELTDMAERYPELQAGINQLFTDFPKGTTRDEGGSLDYRNLKDQMRSAVGRSTTVEHPDSTGRTKRSKRREWTIVERWKPGKDCGVSYVGEDQVWLGHVKPYDLDGKIPFTELILSEDVLGGPGTSTAQIAGGLQDMHDSVVNGRSDLVRAVLNPLVFTNDRSMWENPEVLRRDEFRLVWARLGQSSIWTPVEQAALAAISAAMGEEAAIMRMFQMVGGDSNMSMAANVDPAQVRTATGARMLQANQDVLTKDLVDQFNFSIAADAEMIYLLNRSEMADAVPINPARYERNYSPREDPAKMAWIMAEPMHFQHDGKLTVRLGSTLADDDEANVAKSTNLFQMLAGNPEVNQRTLVQDLLVAHGKGPELQKYMAPEQPAGPMLKASVSYTFKSEEMAEAQRRAVMAASGVPPEMVAQMEQQVSAEAAAQATGAPPPGAGPAAQSPSPMPAGAAGPPPVPPDQIAAMAGAAA